MNKKATGRIRPRYGKSGDITSYQVILYTGKDITGKRICHYFKADTEESAEELLEIKLAEFTLGEMLTPSTMTLKDFIEKEFLPVYCKGFVKPTTMRAYKLCIKYILAEMGAVKLQKITTTQVQIFLNQLQQKSPLSGKPLGYESVMDVRRCFRLIMNVALESEYIKKNPVCSTKVKKPYTDPLEEKHSVFTREEVQKLLEFVRGTPEEAWYSLILDGTLRRGEALALQWSDVEFESSTIIIRKNWVEGDEGLTLSTPKSASSVRKIMLTEVTMKLLKKEYKRYLRMKSLRSDFVGSNRVIFTENGDAWLPKSFYRKYRRTLESAGLPMLSMHALRHTGITLQIEGGAKLNAVSKRAGHSSCQITSDIYTHATKNMEKETVDIMTTILQSAVNS